MTAPKFSENYKEDKLKHTQRIKLSLLKATNNNIERKI